MCECVCEMKSGVQSHTSMFVESADHEQPSTSGSVSWSSSSSGMVICQVGPVKREGGKETRGDLP